MPSDAVALFRAAYPDAPVEKRVTLGEPGVERARKRLARKERGGVGAVLFNGKGQILLLRHERATGWPSDAWAIPGGGVQAHEAFEDAVEREVLEETGLRVHAKEPLLFLDERFAADAETAAFPFVFWRCVLGGGDHTPRPKPFEIRDVAWYHKLPRGAVDRDILLRFMPKA